MSPVEGDATSLINEQAPGWLANFLPGQRWFGDKTRRLTGIAVEDLALNQADDELHVFLIAAVSFDQGPPSTYFVPLALVPHIRSTIPLDTVIAAITTPSGDYRVVDAFTSTMFRRRLIDHFSAQASLPMHRGTLVWSSTSDSFSEKRTDAQQALENSRVLEAEQSNTSVIYGNTLFLKAFRKLQPGVNPDLEIGRFLTMRTSFRNFPALLGEMLYQSEDGSSTALGMVQAFSPSLGDAWSITLERLHEAITSEGDIDPAGNHLQGEALVDAARLLGKRTGELHLALASVHDDEAFAPEPITEADVQRWSSSLRTDLDHVLSELSTRTTRLPNAVIDRLAAGDIATSVEPRLRGFQTLVGVEKTRVHGDYHLGQVLWTRSGDFVILDFEGEPARALEERRRKTSPLKDVAGMLRSFAYAGAATRLADPGALPLAEVVTRRWEQEARSAFLAGYSEETVAKGAGFVPSDQDHFASAVSAWELDKVVYEIHYELNNRPDWLHLPLEALRQPSPK